MRRAILCGYYGMGNGGDEALLATLLQLLPKDIVPIVLSGDPAMTEELHQVQACDRKNVWNLIDVIKQADIFIWGGGSLIQDATSWRNPIYYAGLMGLAKQMNLVTVAWAQGVGPLHQKFSQKIAKRAYQACDLVSVRDSNSAHLLADWQIPCLLAPDPVWALRSQLVLNLSSLPAPRVAVVLRDHPLLTSKRLQNLGIALCNLQKATGAHLLILPFQPAQDMQIAQQIYDLSPANATIMVQEDPRSLKGIFKGVEMTIAMRLHGLIMAAAEGSRCWGISYDPKVNNLMQELEIPGWDLANLPDQPNVICQKWLEHYANGDPLSSAKIQSMGDRALIHQQLLANL
ncbi:polysaccharide pyruvyl transferase CsaB [Thalassoporum mexicanum PCC 7367]|uniref:polysaccharide pyruvyl transferase CsaB n=1 Tax=Thalassoporum mexicanum TaxID=3457544 RepID=UPI00029FF2C7|nr:polysaccharide pyruvyl transferase CsaB [Pseudanabaena sp. PCC 7367]AFY71177.1 polysaccharide pyruvyl transferase CsaB [Pseudanabaena sp. PCC 7367]